MGDLVRFWYAARFSFSPALTTLLHEGHVRVDVFYAGLTRRSKGRVNAFGAIFLGMSLLLDDYYHWLQRQSVHHLRAACKL